MTAVTLYRIDPNQAHAPLLSDGRATDLFGQWCLTRAWGRIGSNGQSRIVPFPAPEEAVAALGKQRHLKERRGYAAQDK
jgi:predicted DNA-binding WGR domain protein